MEVARAALAMARATFQTLIGTVKTGIQKKEEALKRMFQTLIGTVKTLKEAGLSMDLINVSNPHRYGQNERH